MDAKALMRGQRQVRMAQIGDATLYCGSCLDVMPDLELAHAVVTDPPYGLGFMGKDWDHEVPGRHFWEAVRALPGAHLLAFGGTRKFHRLACAIEDAGWELRDTLGWLYGSGFPKSLDVSKAIDKAAGVTGGKGPMRRGGERLLAQAPGGKRDGEGVWGDESGRDAYTYAPATDAAKQWQGWGTAFKPAWEPIIMARRPLAGTVAANVLKHGTGGINVDGCRVGDFVNMTPSGADRFNARNHELGYRPNAYQRGMEDEASADRRYTNSGSSNFAALPGPRGGSPSGRWPANIIHDGSDEAVGVFPQSNGQQGNVRGTEPSHTGEGACYGDYRRVPASKRGDSGSASRFFYCAKASKAERDAGCDAHRRNTHPTVKPQALMRYICTLVTPHGGIVLDPFMGSGSAGVASLGLGFRFIGIELDPANFEIACARIGAAQQGLRL